MGKDEYKYNVRKKEHLLEERNWGGQIRTRELGSKGKTKAPSSLKRSKKRDDT